MSNTTFKFDNIDFEIEFNIPKCFVLKKEFGINLLNLFEEENLGAFASLIALNDEKILDIWWWIVSTKLQDKDKALELITRDFLTKFKECLWQAVINFSDRDAKPILLEFKKRLPELLKQNALNMFQAESEQQNKNS